jgi:ATP-dependent Lon protease
MVERRIPQKSLPHKPNAEYLRKQAKRIARDQSMRLTAAQRQLAHEYGRRNWAELMAAVESMTSTGANGGAQGSLPSSGSPPTFESSPNVFPFLALRGLVAFPHVSYPIFVGRPMSRNAVLYAQEHRRPVLLVTQKDPVLSEPSSSDMYEVGTIADLVETLRMGDGTIKATLEGKRRAHITRFIFNEHFSKAEAEEIQESPASDALLAGLVTSVVFEFARKRVGTFARTISDPQALPASAKRPDEASALADRIASELQLELALKQALLEIRDPVRRLEELLTYLKALNALG